MPNSIGSVPIIPYSPPLFPFPHYSPLFHYSPVVETDFGYHIIQVLQHNEPQTINLDEKTKKDIVSFLEHEKMQEAFASLEKKLRAKANILIHGQ